MNPKGKLLIIGGAENLASNEAPDMETKNIKFKRYEILKELLSVSKRSIAIITTASRFQHDVRRTYLYAFERLSDTSPHFIQIHSIEQCKDKYYLKIIKEVGAVFFTGGDQSRLTSILGKTKFISIIKERYLNDKEFLLAGTSAGAMALGDMMITSGGHSEALIARDLNISKGLNIINRFIIDTHFIKRARMSRLLHAVLTYPNHLGIGLGEDTALIVKDQIAQCRGSGMVMILDTSNVIKTNIKTAKKGEPIFAENVKMHVLVKDNQFSFKHKSLIKMD